MAGEKCIGAGKVAEVFAHGAGRVLKLYRAGQPESDARREAAVLDLLAAEGVRAPRCFGVVAVERRWGVVMERVEGRPFAEPMLADPAAAGPYFAAMARLQAGLHAASGAGLEPLKQRLERKIARAQGLAGPVKARLRDRLAGLPEGDRLLHGDFHPYNILGEPSDAVIIDWLDASRGPPAADVCRSWLLLRSVSETLAEAYLAAYLAGGTLDRASVLGWLPVLAAARLDENVPEEVPALLAMAAAV